MLAAWNGYAQSAQLLLDYGARVNVPSPSGTTALMAAITRGHTALVSLFLGYGAEVEATNQSGAHLVLRATGHGYTDIVQLLLTHGARTATQDAYGWGRHSRKRGGIISRLRRSSSSPPRYETWDVRKEYASRLSQAALKRSYHRASANQRRLLKCRGTVYPYQEPCNWRRGCTLRQRTSQPLTTPPASLGRDDPSPCSRPGGIPAGRYPAFGSRWPRPARPRLQSLAPRRPVQMRGVT